MKFILFILIITFLFIPFLVLKSKRNSKNNPIRNLPINSAELSEKEDYINNSKKRIHFFSIIILVFMVLFVVVPATFLIIENFHYKTIDKEVFDRRMKDTFLMVVLPTSIFAIVLIYFSQILLNNMVKKSYNIIGSFSEQEFANFIFAHKQVSALNRYFFPIAVKAPYLYVFKLFGPQQIEIAGIHSIKITKNTYKGVSYSVFIDGATKCYFKFGNDYAIVEYLMTELKARNRNIQWDKNF